MSRRVFVTGGTGFVGAELTRLLLKAGHEVGLLVRNRQQSKRLFGDQCGLVIFDGDLFEPVDVKAALDTFRPNALLHLGWSGISGKDRDNEVQVENQIATIRLLQSAIEIGIDTFVGIGSQAEYGPKDGIIDELQACHPSSLYGACKLSCCKITEQLCRVAGVRFAWMRLFSCYGPGDTPSFMIPNLIETLLRKECPSLTEGIQVWDYLFVQDAASAIAHVSASATANGIFNLGSGIGVTVREVIEQVRDLIDKDLPLGFGKIGYANASVMHLQADISLLAQTGWQPTVSLQNGLLKTVNWHRNKNFQ